MSDSESGKDKAGQTPPKKETGPTDGAGPAFGPSGKQGAPEKPVGNLDKPSKDGEDFAIDEHRDKSLRGRQDPD